MTSPGRLEQTVQFLCSSAGLPLFPGTCHPTGRKRHDVISRELQFGCSPGRQPQPDALAADAAEHLVVHEIGVQAVYSSRTGAREFEKQSVDLRLAGGLGGVGVQRVSVGVGMKREIKSYTPRPALAYQGARKTNEVGIDLQFSSVKNRIYFDPFSSQTDKRSSHVSAVCCLTTFCDSADLAHPSCVFVRVFFALY